MIEQQIIFKKCMLSALALLANNILDGYLAEDLTANGTTNSFYNQRRQLTLNHQLGGNPTIGDRATWMKTIASNPALLKIDRYIPWWDVITDTAIKQNMQKAIANRLDQVVKNRREQEAQNQNELVSATIDLSVGFTLPNIVWDSFFPRQDGQKCLTIGPIKFNSSLICKYGCDLSQLFVTEETLSNLKNVFTYVRDQSTGAFHIVFKGFEGNQLIVGSDVYGAGCSAIMPSGNNNNIPIFPVMICSGCTLTSTRDGCSCPCPAY